MNKRNIEDIFRLTPVQHGMLVADQAHQASLLVERVAYDLVGAIDEARFRHAWDLLAARHGALRTGFLWKNRGEPVQFVLRAIAPALAVRDLRDCDPDDAGERCAELARRPVRFDLAKPPLYDAVLVMLPEGRSRLLLAIHHLLIDGDSQFMLIRELVEAYNASATRSQWQPAPSAPFSAYVKWVRGGADREDAGRAFWQDHLGGISAPTALGESAPPPTTPAAGHEEVELILDEALSAGIDKVARARGLVPNTLIQAAWALVLAAMSGDDKVAFGVTLSERPDISPSLENTVGLFINTVPLAVDAGVDGPLGDFLAGLQESFIDLRDHGAVATAQIHDWSSFPAALPLFDSLLVVENYAAGPPAAVPGEIGAENGPENGNAEGEDALWLADFGGEGARTNYPLTVLVAPASRMMLKAVFQPRAIPARSAGLLLDHMAMALSCLVAALEGDESLRELRAALSSMERPAIHVRPDRERAGVAAVGDTESRLLAIWREVLEIDDVGVTDDLFALGGHSLLATRLIARIRETMSVDVGLSDLFGAASVRALAALIDARDDDRGEAVPSSLPILVPDPDAAHDPFPLTDIQQAYWAGRSELFEGGTVATHSYMELNGPALDEARFNAALDRLIARHPMLRMVVDANGMQRILADVPRYEIAVADLRDLDDAARAEALAATRDSMSHEVLASDRWPLFNIAASRLSDDTARLHVSIDMLIVDGSSQHILFRDLAAIYLDREDELPELGITFRDYVIAQEKARGGAAYAAARDYWHRRIATLPLSPRLPLATDPEAISKPRFVRRKTHVEAPVWDALRRSAGQHGLTMSAVLCTIYADVLRRWCESPDFTLNLTLFNRLPIHEHVGELVGDFTATMLLEVSDGALPTFVERAQALQQRSWRDLDHREFTGVEVLREMARRRGGSRAAAMPVVFTSALVLDDAGEQEEASPLMGHPDDYASGQTSQVWLDFQVLEQGGGLTMLLDAVEALFPDGVIDGIFDGLERQVEELARGRGWIGESIDPLPADQISRREAFNATERAFDLQPIAEFVRAIAPDDTRPAILCSDLAIERATLARWVAALAARLQADGVGPGRAVIVEMHKGWAQAISSLAVCLAGGFYVPVDARWPLDRRRAVHAQLPSAPVLTDDPSRERASETEHLAIDRDMLEALPDRAPSQAASLDDLAYVIFTSGSTGTPKGVMIDHRGAANTIADLNGRLELGSGDRVLGLSSLSFDLSVYDIFGVLAAGGALVLPEASLVQDPAHWQALMRRHGVTLFNGVPALMQILVEHLEAARETMPGDLRAVLMSGDWIPVGLPDRIRALSPTGPGPALYSLGGATEASIWSVLHEIGDVDPNWRSIPYGTPMANQSMHVLDGDFRPLPEDVIGDLFIGGTGLAKGYWQDEERTRAAFLHHPRTGERLYRTGDRAAQRRAGFLEFHGRMDDQVKLRGHRIELGEVEAAFAGLPGVRSCVAALTDAAALERQLVAYVVLEEAEAVRLTDLRDQAAVRLPPYMVPAFVTAIDAVPLSANGKVDRSQLPAPADASSDGAAPSGEHGSERLAELWAEILGVRPDRAEANFFDLGGNSVSMLRLIARLRAEDGLNVDVRRFFDNPDFRAMSALVEAGSSGTGGSTVTDIAARERVRIWLSGADPATRADALARHDIADGAGAGAGTGDEADLAEALVRRGFVVEPRLPAPLSFEQERMWFGAKMRDEGQYNLVEVRELPSDTDPAGLKAILATLVARHEGLRTRFVETAGVVRQVVLDADRDGLFAFAVREACDVSVADMRDELLATESAWRFDLANDPVLRVTFARCANGRVLLAVNIAHIVCDGVSLATLTREMQLIAGGEEASLPALPATYSDFALWQRWWMGSDDAEAQERYWTRRLAHLPLVDFDPPEEPQRRGSGMVRLNLSDAKTQALKALAGQAGATLFGALTGVFAAALHSVRGTREFGIGTSVANRPTPELEPVVGLFLNQVVLRMDLAGNPTPLRLIEAVRRDANAAFANALLPFDAVVAATARDRQRADMPVFNVFLTLQNAAIGTEEPHPSEGPEQIAAKFDFSLFCNETADGLDVLAIYDRDRVAGTQAERIAQAFHTLADAFAASPDRPLNLLSHSGESSFMDHDRPKAPRLKLGERRRRGVDLSQLELTRESVHGEGGLPWIVEARQDIDFPRWARENASHLEAKLFEHGAILFRGFDIRDKERLQAAQDALCRDAIQGYGDLPEEAGSRQIYKSTPYPNDRMILFHNESSHQARWPTRQFFACVIASEEGGETPIVDCRKVAERLGASLVGEFERRGLMYVRTFIEGLDVDWRAFFKTDDRAEVERICAASGDDCRWFDDGTLQVRRRAAAVVRHPVTGETSFFNQIQLHEPHFLAPAEKEALRSVYGAERLPRNVMFGDGEPIPPDVLERILSTTMELSVALPWRAGDMMMLDNMLVAHARNPFRGERKIIVALGDPHHAVRHDVPAE